MYSHRVDIKARRLRSKTLKRLARHFIIRLGSRVRALVRPRGLALKIPTAPHKY